MGDHARGGGTAGGEHRAEVGVDQILELLPADSQDRRLGWLSGSSAVHQSIDLTELVLAQRDQGVRDSILGGRARQPDSITTGGRDGADGRFDGISIASVDHNAGTQLGQQCGDRSPDPA